MFGSPVAFTVPDLDRTDYLVDHRREPAGVQRQSGHRRRLPRQAAGAAQARRHARRHRPGPHPHRRTRRPPPRAAARHRRRPAVRRRPRAVRRGPGRRSGRIADHVNGVDEVRALARGLRAGDRGRALRGRPPRRSARWPANSPPPRPPPCTAGSAPPPSNSAPLGSWLVDVINVLTGNLDRPGGAMFPLSPVAPAPRRPRPGRGFSTGRWHSRVSGHPEVLSELPVGGAGRGDRDPRRRTDQGDDHDRGQPGAVGPGRRPARPRAGRRRVHGERRPLPQRDDPPRRRHPAATAAVAAAHFDFALNNLAVRNNARYSPPAAAAADGRPDEAEILSRIALVIYGIGHDARSGTGRRTGASPRRWPRRPPTPPRRSPVARSTS